eukprot:gene34756-39296_t
MRQRPGLIARAFFCLKGVRGSPDAWVPSGKPGPNRVSEGITGNRTDRHSMSRGHSAALPEHSNRSALSAFLFRQFFALSGFALFLLLVLAVAALATWNVSDPSLSYATDNPPTNILGLPGAVFADLMMQFFGLGSLLALLPVLAWSFALIGGRRLHRIPARLGAWL